MVRIGSWARFIVGILLSVEVIRQIIMGDSASIFAVILAVIFLVLAVVYFVFRF